MLNNFPQPNFAKNSYRRATSYSNNGSINQEIIAKEHVDPTGKNKLKFVELEIADREACKLLRTLCLDASQHLFDNSSGGDYEIDDLLTGILLLGNICKRLVQAKKSVEDVLHNSTKEHINVIHEKDTMMAQLEGAILKLRDENVRAADELVEVQMRHDKKMTMLTKELANVKDQHHEDKAEIARLNLKVSNLERRIMEIPRLEEKYLRTARKMVSVQEAATTVKEVGFKKLEEDVKSLVFYKNKVQGLEDTIQRQKADVENYSSQARSALSKYQTLLSQYNMEKRQARNGNAKKSQGGRPQSAPALKRMQTIRINDLTITSADEFISSPTADAKSGGASNKTPLARQMSNMHRMRSDQHLFNANTGLATTSNDSFPGLNVDIPPATPIKTSNEGNNNINSSTKHGKSVSMHRDFTKNDSTPTIYNTTLNFVNGADNKNGNEQQQNKTVEELQAEELAKLRYQHAQKDSHIIKLAQKLSYARAYPLFSTADEPEAEHVDERGGASSIFNSTGASNSSGKTLTRRSSVQQVGLQPEAVAVKPKYDYHGSGKANIKAFFASLDDMDLDSVNSEFVSTEKAMLNKRFEDAENMELQYQNRILRVREKNTPTVRNVRQTKSFAKPKDID